MRTVLNRHRGQISRETFANCLFLFVLASLSLCVSKANAFTPDSPEVKKLIDKAVKYLDTADDNRLGGKCLIGMVFLKLGEKDDHPKVKAAVEACKQACAKAAEAIKEDVYSTGIAIIFLCEADPSKYRPEIEKLMKSLELRQREAGGWGYPPGGAHGDTGDTSMTQYAVLATWSSYRGGIQVSQDSVERVCNWLLRIQDPSGAFGYQGHDPGVGRFVRIEQSEIRNSLCAAASGSLYICADLLRFKQIKEQVQSSDLPPALVLVEGDGKAPAGPIAETVPSKIMMKGLADANAWMARNYTIDQGSWNLYHLYALERYQSFRELAENIDEKEPKWYNDGVRHLAKTQSAQGTWDSNCGEPIDTAFGVLFLLRSTKKSIQKSLKKFGDGALTGGRGLPTNAGAATIKHGKVVGSLSGEIEDLVSVLEEGGGSDFEYVTNNTEEFKLSDDPAERKEQILRLRRLVAAGSYEARQVAVKALARSRDFDSVPQLIYALSDPDPRVVLEAEMGLRYVARRFGPSTLSDKPDEKEIKALIAEWTKWYASVRPEADIPR